MAAFRRGTMTPLPSVNSRIDETTITSLDALLHHAERRELTACGRCPRSVTEVYGVWAACCPQDFYDSTRTCKAMFVYRDPSAGSGGPGTTGILCADHNTDQSARWFRRFTDTLGPIKKEIYLTNAVMHGRSDASSPNHHRVNKAPERASLNSCYKVLRRQIEILRPELVVGFGFHAAWGVCSALDILPLPRRIGDIFGPQQDRQDPEVFFTYHPSPFNRNRNKKGTAMQAHLEMIRERLMRPGHRG